MDPPAGSRISEPSPGPTGGSRLRLRRLGAGGGAALRQVLADEAVRRIGFAESDAVPADLITAATLAWAIEGRLGDVGVVWLDPCRRHRACAECALFVLPPGRGQGPRALLAVLLYARDRLGVAQVCFEVKEYNSAVLAMCRRAGIASQGRRRYRDDYHPAGATDLAEFVIEVVEVARQPERAGVLLRWPIEMVGGDGVVEYVPTLDSTRGSDRAEGS